ncbi:MAG: hypothetical protein AB1780_05915 [Pseudomonadota bacterium]
MQSKCYFAENDLVDGEVTAELLGSSELVSDAHELELRLTDSLINSLNN